MLHPGRDKGLRNLYAVGGSPFDYGKRWKISFASIL
jgi:hypothetical protein